MGEGKEQEIKSLFFPTTRITQEAYFQENNWLLINLKSAKHEPILKGTFQDLMKFVMEISIECEIQSQYLIKLRQITHQQFIKYQQFSLKKSVYHLNERKQTRN